MSNFNFYMKEVGKTIKSSKIKHVWEVTIDGQYHTVELFSSKISGKLKVVKDGTVLFFEDEFSGLLSLPFTIGKHNCSLIQSGENYEFRIDNMVFSHLMELEKSKNLFGGNDPISISYKPAPSNIQPKPTFGIGEVKSDNANKQQPNKGQFNFSIKETTKTNQSTSIQNKFSQIEDKAKSQQILYKQIKTNTVIPDKTQEEEIFNNDVFENPPQTTNKTLNLDDIFSAGNSNQNFESPFDIPQGNTNKDERANQILNQYNNIFDDSAPQTVNFNSTIDFTSKPQEDSQFHISLPKTEPKDDKKKDLDIFLNNLTNSAPTYNQQPGYQMYPPQFQQYPPQYGNYGLQPTYINPQAQLYHGQNAPFNHQQSVHIQNTQQSIAFTPQDFQNPLSYKAQPPQQTSSLDFFETVKPNNQTNYQPTFNDNSKQNRNANILDDFFG